MEHNLYSLKIQQEHKERGVQSAHELQTKSQYLYFLRFLKIEFFTRNACFKTHRVIEKVNKIEFLIKVSHVESA